jgi:uncharacterized membrane protein/ketosteroid isomerase-like protein
MLDLIEPNIHPILVHFAYAMSIGAVLSYLGARFAPQESWRASLKPAGDWMLTIAALGIIATIAAGFQAYYTVDHDTPSHAAMTTHRNWAVPSGILILLLAAWRWFDRANLPKGLFVGLLTLAAIPLTITAWWGGHIVYNYGLGVKSLPQVSGPGHGGHEHPDGGGHGESGDTEKSGDDAPAAEDHDATPHGHGDEAASEESGDESAAAGEGHSDGGHDEGDMSDAAAMPVAPEGHDNSDGHHDKPDTAATKNNAGDVVLSAGADAGVVNLVTELADEYHEALRSGYKEGVELALMPDVILAEGGGAERSFEQYAGHHMPSDMTYTAAMDTTLVNRDVMVDENIAIVISEMQMQGSFQDKDINSRMMETMVMKNTDDGWRIAHIHWSSAPIKAQEEH